MHGRDSSAFGVSGLLSRIMGWESVRFVRFTKATIHYIGVPLDITHGSGQKRPGPIICRWLLSYIYNVYMYMYIYIMYTLVYYNIFIMYTYNQTEGHLPLWDIVPVLSW